MFISPLIRRTLPVAVMSGLLLQAFLPAQTPIAQAQNDVVPTVTVPENSSGTTPDATVASPAPPTTAVPQPEPVEITVTEQGVSLEADNADVVATLKNLAQASGTSVVFINNPASPITGTVSVSIRNAPVARAIALVARSAGLFYRRDDNTFLVGNANDLVNLAPPSSDDGANVRVYRCRHINATALAATLTATYDPQRLRAVVGPTYDSPILETASSNDSTGGYQTFSPLLPQSGDEQLRTPAVILAGETALVESALQLCAQLDTYRAQVRLQVNIADVSLDSARDFGIQYDFSDPLTFSEATRPPEGGVGLGSRPSLSIGRFTRSGFSFSAALSALESRNRAKVLAEPTLSLLDGERSFILIGDRLILPVLVAFTPGIGPTYSQQEVRIGIYIQVAAQIGDDDEVVLSIYPQVSSITGLIDVGGTKYPQIATREQQTTIRARNGETVVIGGLIREEETKNLQRVPILGRIPILKELFTFRSKSKMRSELIIAITPQIVRGDGQIQNATLPEMPYVPGRATVQLPKPPPVPAPNTP